MKQKVTLLLSCLLCLYAAHAQRPFITTWNTGLSGFTGDHQISFTTSGSGFTVSWVNTANAADTSQITGTAGLNTITFANKAIYKVYITPGTGTFSDINLYGFAGDHGKLVSIEQWGDIHWTTFHNAFGSSYLMVMNATDTPDLSSVTDMSFAFIGCSSLTTNDAMSRWDVSGVTNMSSLFSNASKFNQPIGTWDVSHVTDMSALFYLDYVFNQPLNDWDVSSVTNMNGLFYLSAFNQPLDQWDVSNVTNMGSLFSGYYFNQPIGNWNVSKVTSMYQMFNGDIAFNQPLGNWDVSSVKDMSQMFSGASAFNQPIGSWDVGNVTTMNSMFQSANVFNQPIGSWNVSQVTDMGNMFTFNTGFNQPVGTWDVSHVTNMYGMFARTKVFNQPLAAWNVSSVTNMNAMFQGTPAFNQPIGNWDVSHVTGMGDMFSGAAAFNQPIGSWNTGSVTEMSEMFYYAGAFNQPIGSWNVSSVNNMASMFKQAFAFNQSIGSWNVGNVGNMNSMFYEAPLFNQPIGSWNVSRVNNMTGMFTNATAFNQNLGSWTLAANPTLYTMLDGSGMSCANYSYTLKGWVNNPQTSYGLTLGAAGLTYDTAYAKAAHDSLVNTKFWTISGDAAGDCSALLPVTLLSFTAVKQDNGALLTWHVANEVNTKGYLIEKSTDGSRFTAIGFVSAKGAAQNTTYSFTDNTLSNGTSYYRLKQVDNSGASVYSSVQRITVSGFAWKILGNPVRNSSVQLSLDKPATVSVQVFSATGALVETIREARLSAGTYTLPLHLDGVGAGTYLMRLLADGKTYTASLVKQ